MSIAFCENFNFLSRRAKDMIFERIKKYCTEEKITISEFEKRCEIGNGTVGKWKNSKSEPSIRILSKIAYHTGTTIGYWLGGIL